MVIERFVYGESRTIDNGRGQVIEHWDSSGLLTHDAFDFTSTATRSSRRLAAAFDAEVIDWSTGSPTAQLESEEFRKFVENDALGRMRRLINWHSDPSHVAVYLPVYDERGGLRSETLTIAATLRDEGDGLSDRGRGNDRRDR